MLFLAQLQPFCLSISFGSELHIPFTLHHIEGKVLHQFLFENFPMSEIFERPWYGKYWNPLISSFRLLEFWGELLKDKKITRRTTGARGCKFWTILNNFEAFWTIPNYLELSRTILDYLGLSRTILDSLGQSRNISDYLVLSRTISDYLRLSQTISDYLRLSQTISDYLGLSRAISGYLGLSRTISGFLKLSRTILDFL